VLKNTKICTIYDKTILRYLSDNQYKNSALNFNYSKLMKRPTVKNLPLKEIIINIVIVAGIVLLGKVLFELYF